jgi:hypothetical protein
LSRLGGGGLGGRRLCQNIVYLVGVNFHCVPSLS